MPSTDDNRECYTQACEEARHYSKLRFTMATWGIGISWGLIALTLGKDLQYPKDLPATFIPIAAMVLAAVFLCAEYRISKLVGFYQEEAQRLKKEFGYIGFELLSGHYSWKHLARVTMWMPQGFALVFWLLRLNGF